MHNALVYVGWWLFVGFFVMLAALIKAVDWEDKDPTFTQILGAWVLWPTTLILLFLSEL